MRDYRKYEIWQLSHQLVLETYKASQSFPGEEIFGHTSQIRRAAASTPTNIAEGCGRASDKEFNNFLNFALGSANETEYLFILSKDLGYINEKVFDEFFNKINVVKSKIFKLKEKLK